MGAAPPDWDPELFKIAWDVVASPVEGGAHPAGAAAAAMQAGNLWLEAATVGAKKQQPAEARRLVELAVAEEAAAEAALRAEDEAAMQAVEELRQAAEATER